MKYNGLPQNHCGECGPHSDGRQRRALFWASACHEKPVSFAATQGEVGSDRVIRACSAGVASEGRRRYCEASEKALALGIV
eukprot:1244384-Rhodomonas_salina.1